ncbi:uncharacterized protein LOC131847872 [Achroia grisella]|uniref:uncharacterized protein LOC131847872 n=1 Tax=Achroia grisella TaxID=688607 RepID=UPI0027D217FD|nr:uncharacterized protein LOC131847872 [Achroia grisella]
MNTKRKFRGNECITNIKEKQIEAKVKSIISTVLERCKKEHDSSTLQVPLDEYVQRASYYTAFPKNYICALEDEERNLLVKTEGLSIKQIIGNLECISKFLYNRTLPTYSLIYKTLKNSIDMPEFNIYKREMYLMGYHYKKTNNGPLLVEDPKFSFERFHYLSRIKKLRSKDANICYIDVRIINEKQAFERLTNLKDSSDENNDQFIFLHSISKNGYINGLCTNNICEENFTKWIIDILLPNLNPATTIVVDKTLFEIISPCKSISRYDSKYEMIEWLRSNSIPYYYEMEKPELYDLISNSKIKPKCKLEQIIKAFGHNMLCLPLKLNKLTPIDLLWGHIIKLNIRKENENSLLSIKQYIVNYIKDLSPTMFDTFTKTVEQWENEIYQYDRSIEKLIDQQYKFDTTYIEDEYMPQYFYGEED